MNRQSPVDYCSNTVHRTFPRGLDTEIFTFAALETAWREAVERPDREHVTPFLYNHPARFRIDQVVDSVDRSAFRWTLDTPADYEFLQAVCSSTGLDAEYGEILGVLEEHPDWLAINRHIRQKAYGE
jgi:spore coat polysaccharide biosynthesis protein SpsF